MAPIPIENLPEELRAAEAVEAAYRDELDQIREKLTQGLSVLVECDKELVSHLYLALRGRFKGDDSGPGLRLVSGHGSADGGEGAGPVLQTFMQRILGQLREAVYSGSREEIVVLPHLDILTTTTRSGLSAETREAAALMYENPEIRFLGFKDPSFELAGVVENAFAMKVSLLGLHRERLPALVCQREARKFGDKTFDPYALYKYVSGLNAIRFRQILSHLRDRLDFSPANPEFAENLLREIREMTLVTDVDLPSVDLETDVGGYESVKKRIREDILDLLAAKDRAEGADIRHLEEIIPKGIIFHGPPGTGKTLFAKAMATAIDATLTVVSGPELKSKWVGESEENLRRVFAQARRSAPSIIVFDELDSFAAARGTYAGSGVEHSMVNQMLTEMDGFRKEEMVFVIGTTNFMASLDSALLRPGRFELAIEIPAPNESDREAILKIYRDKFGLEIDDETLDYMVRRTAGFADDRLQIRFTGDHLHALVRGLKREQFRRGGGDQPFVVRREDVDQVLDGGDKKGLKFQQQEEDTIAVHEGGHAILAYVLPHCPTIEKVTISTGQEDMLGYVMQAVRKNKYITTGEELLDDVCVLLGGRAAEELLLGRVSVGAYNDLQRANEIVRMMVEELGMSDVLGSRTVGSQGQGGAAMTGGGGRRPIAESTARLIDDEIQRILDRERDRAAELLLGYQTELEKLRDLLLERKTLRVGDLKDIFDGRDFKADSAPAPAPSDSN